MAHRDANRCRSDVSQEVNTGLIVLTVSFVARDPKAEGLSMSISRPRCAQEWTSGQASRIARRDFVRDPNLMRLPEHRYMDQVSPAVVSLSN